VVQGVAAVGAAIVVGALAVHERDWALLGLGVALIGIGRWKDQQSQEGLPFWHQGVMLKPSREGYEASIAGTVMVVMGVVLFARAIWRIAI
jgi:hypothetical protein